MLLERLEASGIGCYIGHEYFGSLCSADDLTLLAPTLLGLRNMIRICETFGLEYDILFNPLKTVCMLFGYKGCLSKIPKLQVNGKLISWSHQAKHLGNTVASDLNEHLEIHAKKCDFIGRVNSLIANFKSVSRPVVSKLFNSQCCHLYGSQAWSLDEKILEPFVTSWRKAIRKIWCLPHTARSHLLPYLAESMDLESMVYARVANLYRCMLEGHNPKMAHLINTSIDMKHVGFIGENIIKISRKWNCSFFILKNNRYIINDEIALVRVNIIKELSTIRLTNGHDLHITGFSHEDICEMLQYIATYR